VYGYNLRTVLGTPTQILSTNLADVMRAWGQHMNGDRDLLYWIVQLQLARSFGQDERALAEVPGALRDEVRRRHAEVNAYWDNVRYSLLDPLTQVWGTIVNALRVAADTSSVTPGQKKVFAFSLDSVVAFFRAAHARPEACEALWEAFRPMPAPDCQALAAVLHPNARIDASSLVGLVRLLSGEGPLSTAETELLGLLSSTGLQQYAFRGARGG